jgi:hypothetical protein
MRNRMRSQLPRQPAWMAGGDRTRFMTEPQKRMGESPPHLLSSILVSRRTRPLKRPPSAPRPPAPAPAPAGAKVPASFFQSVGDLSIVAGWGPIARWGYSPRVHRLCQPAQWPAKTVVRSLCTLLEPLAQVGMLLSSFFLLEHRGPVNSGGGGGRLPGGAPPPGGMPVLRTGARPCLSASWQTLHSRVHPPQHPARLRASK